MSQVDSGKWGSDAIAEAIRSTGVEYITLNPGSSYRGIHDSLVNHLGNTDPEILLCIHEEHAVAIAHGYAKVTERPLAVALHSNVGLMHATMAIFNAYCDRIPMLIFGATGPIDAEARRPWIDWVHTSADLGALIRPYVKWDDQPASVRASVASIFRANQLTRSSPCAPTYVCFDVSVQEHEADTVADADRSRYGRIDGATPSHGSVRAAADILSAAQTPVILAGRVSRKDVDWAARVRLAERLGARVITDLRVAAAFPTDHPLHHGTPGLFLSDENNELLRMADVILSLDWLDLGGTLRQAFGTPEPHASIISASDDHNLFNGWVKNDHVLPATDVSLNGPADAAVSSLLHVLAGDTPQRRPGKFAKISANRVFPTGPTGRLTVAYLAASLRDVLRDRRVTLVRTPFAWDASWWPVRGPLDYLGTDGGGGLGSGPGLAVGAGLALRAQGRIPLAVLGDGDYLMGVTALWTAARYDIPVLVVVANNNSFFNDEVHQDRVARTRGRSVENAHIGMRLEEPDPDLAQLARGQGAAAFGPVHTADDLHVALKQGVAAALEGRPTVLDVRVERGYGAHAVRPIAGEER